MPSKKGFHGIITYYTILKVIYHWFASISWFNSGDPQVKIFELCKRTILLNGNNEIDFTHFYDIFFSNIQPLRLQYTVIIIRYDMNYTVDKKPVSDTHRFTCTLCSVVC